MNVKFSSPNEAPAARLEGAIVDALLDGVVTIRVDGRIVGFNRAAEDMFGYSRAEVLDENVRILMPEPFSSGHDGYLKNYVTTGEAKIIGTGRKVTGRRRDGSVFPMHLAISEGWDGDSRIFTGIVRDLTDDEAARARLRNSFMLLFSRSNEAMFLGDGQGNIIDANAEMCRLLETPSEKLLATRVEDVLVGGREENLERRARRAEQGAVSSSASVRTGSGRILEVRYWEVEFEDELGNLRILIGARDAEAEAELARVTAILKALFETSPDGYLVTDDAGRTLYANRAHLDFWRLDSAAMANSFEDRWERTRLRLKEPGLLAQLTLTARANQDDTLVERMELVDGPVVEVRSIPIYSENGRRLGRSFATRDITAERQAEAVLRESEQRYRTLVSSLPVGVVMQYADGRIGAANAAAERILGLTEDQLLGLTSLDPRWRAVDEAGEALAKEEHPAVITLRTGRACHNITMGVSHANGALRWLLVNSEPLPDEHGGVGGVVVSFQDITEQRLAEQAMVKARTAEAFQSLASGVAHKVNNALTSIVGNAYLAGLSGEVSLSTSESLGEITAAAGDATALVRDLLALSGKSHNALRSITIEESLQAVLASLSLLERHCITVRLEQGLPDVLVDPSSLSQAISNVLRNALEAGEQIWVHAFIEANFAPKPEAVYSPARPLSGRYLVVEVQDDGPGIDPSMAGRLFEPFATTKFAGRGLGLAATSGIMATHHGFVGVSSTPGGCRVSLLFPLP